MTSLSLELLTGPAPTTGDAKEIALYFLRMAKVEENHRKNMTARIVRSARRHGLPHRVIGEVLGHTEGWVRQYLKDIEGKTELWDFADGGFAGDKNAHDQFFKDMCLTVSFDHKLHVCAEYGLSDGAVASALSISRDRAAELMEGPRAEAAA